MGDELFSSTFDRKTFLNDELKRLREIEALKEGKGFHVVLEENIVVLFCLFTPSLSPLSSLFFPSYSQFPIMLILGDNAKLSLFFKSAIDGNDEEMREIVKLKEGLKDINVVDNETMTALYVSFASVFLCVCVCCFSPSNSRFPSLTFFSLSATFLLLSSPLPLFSSTVTGVACTMQKFVSKYFWEKKR